jgi:type II secretory pathway pseudopilin PulG
MHGTRHNLNQRPGSRGFTIVELLSSLFVIGLILAILIVGLRYFFAAGQSTKQRAAVAQMKQAVADFRSKFGYLPPLVMDQYVAPTPLPGGMAAAGLAQQSVKNAGASGLYRIAVVEDSLFDLWIPTAVANNEYKDPRFSVRTLPYYLMGALDVDITGATDVKLPIDGVLGPGSHRPNSDGSFAVPPEVIRDYTTNPGLPLRKYTAETYLPFIDAGSTDPKLSRAADGLYDAGSDTAPMQLTLRDGKNVVYRYYRWAMKDPANVPPVVNQNIPLLVGNASDAAVRGAKYAIVGAGPNQVFGDEDVTELRTKLGRPLNYPEATARKEAASDNVVEVGQ